MYAPSNHVIRIATTQDDDVLARLASLDAQQPLDDTILIGELDGEPVVALSLADGRAIGDPFRPTAQLLATMRVRARGVHAVEHLPSLRDRLLAGLPTVYRARVTGHQA